MSQLLILSSPPASGKTFWVKSFIRTQKSKVLLISPLRALADECRNVWGDEIAVMTPEEWMRKKDYFPVVIFDEIHLLEYWGSSFRPVMWENFIELSLHAELVIGLTATISEEFKTEIENLSAGFDEIIWINHGNQKLKWVPDNYTVIDYDLMEKALIHLPLEKTSLIFCQYREEVSYWENLLRSRGAIVWGCRGGEASEFSQRVGRESPPDFIVATTVLSHGVNLPMIKRIFFLYPVGNLDFWIQMVARGGRRGEGFEVFALEAPHGLRWSRARNILNRISLQVRISVSIWIDQFEQCFLKESS